MANATATKEELTSLLPMMTPLFSFHTMEPNGSPPSPFVLAPLTGGVVGGGRGIFSWGPSLYRITLLIEGHLSGHGITLTAIWTDKLNHTLFNVTITRWTGQHKSPYWP